MAKYIAPSLALTTTSVSGSGVPVRNSSATALNQSGCCEPSESAGGQGRRSSRPSAVTTSASSSMSMRPSLPITQARFSRESAAQESTTSATARSKWSRTVAVSSTANR